MQPSDWIAIAALGASVIISVAGFWFNYKTNKENIKARRAEIVTEKSIEAFRETVEKLHNLRLLARHIILAATFNNISTMIDAANDCYETLLKNSVYFPRTMAENIDRVRVEMQGLIELSSVEEKREQLENATTKLRELIDYMQAYLGVETQEASKRVKPH